MKRILPIILMLLGFSLLGCEENTTKYVEIDREPAAPQGVYSVTGDEAVYIYWLPIREADFSHYRVFRSLDDIEYHFIGASPKGTEEYIDNNVSNGTTYYYAISAVDQGGNESELSHETVFDTPRPEGQDLLLADFNGFPDDAGFDFSTYSVVPFNSVNADIYVELLNGVFYINVANVETDIQDMGYTYNFDEISYSPTNPDGWSKVGWSEAILGHTYVIWTANDHYAKLRVTSIGSTFVRLDWGYQVAQSNPELARPQHGDDYLRRTIISHIVK